MECGRVITVIHYLNMCFVKLKFKNFSCIQSVTNKNAKCYCILLLIGSLVRADLHYTYNVASDASELDSTAVE